MLSAVQSRMARAALGMGVRELASLADVSPNTVARLERGDALQPRTLEFIRGALEAAGVEIFDLGSAPPIGGEGVRVRLRGARSRYAALFEILDEMPDLTQEASAAYFSLLRGMDAYLHVVADQGRQPDAWESIDLNQALNALSRGQLHLAYAALRHAITPPDNQSPHYPVSKSAADSVRGLDLDYFQVSVGQLRDRGPV